MAKGPEALITPDLLVWARETTHLGLEEAAQRVKVSEDRLRAWEAGTERPTVAQLRKVAQVYRRPLAVFYLPSRPLDFSVPHDYRRVYGASPPLSSRLALEVRYAHQRREIALELAELVGETPTPFADVASLEDDTEELAIRLRQRIGVSLQTQQACKTINEAYAVWRAALEGIGVLVFQASRLEAGEARGFSISAPTFPAIVINSKDALTGRVFSLFHEYAHLLLRAGGICDLEEDQGGIDERIEVFCNRFAGNFLVPASALLKEPEIKAGAPDGEWSTPRLEQLACRFWVSPEVILRRLLAIGQTTPEYYHEKRREFAMRRPPDPDGGPPLHVLRLSQLGRAYSRLVLEAYHGGEITASELVDYLDLRWRLLPKFEKTLASGRGAA